MEIPVFTLNAEALSLWPVHLQKGITTVTFHDPIQPVEDPRTRGFRGRRDFRTWYRYLTTGTGCPRRGQNPRTRNSEGLRT